MVCRIHLHTAPLCPSEQSSKPKLLEEKNGCGGGASDDDMSIVFRTNNTLHI